MISMKRSFTLFTCLLVAATAALGQAKSDGISKRNLANADLALMDNHDPEVEKANFKLLPGYEVNLFAQEPMLANPIHMTWDARGRLWVACSWAYPQLKPGEVANDKIIILEDTDGDGKADKSTVFADGLYMPTGIELANGGCYVAQTPDVFFLKDTDGDDVADVKELPMTGFGIEDSHHSISAWRRGPGGWIYFQEGIFLHSQVETLYGVVRNYNGGVYQFNPRTRDLRIFARIGVGNPWGHVFDRWGQSFFIDNPRVSYLSPATGNSGQRVRMANLISTEKQCGGDLASGTHFPKEIRGQLLTCRFKSRAIIRYEFIEKGSGYTANVLPPLISSSHPNFRPVDCKIGPDGALYVADWYNPIINHAKHNFRDPRRDKDHGRVWRITAKDRPLVKKPKLVDATIAQVVDHLKSPEQWTRHQARNVLAERDRDAVAKEIANWVNKLDPKDPEHDHHLVEAMWACQNVERPSEDILQRVLSAKDGHARSAGARVIRYWHEELADPVALLAKAAGDPFPRVRMEAILSAGYVPKAEAFSAALVALDHPRDVAIDIALPQTVNALESLWRPLLEANKLKFEKDSHRDFAEREAGIGFEKRLGEYLKKKSPGLDETRSIIDRLVSDANLKQARMVVDAVSRKKPDADPEVMVVMLEGLAKIGRMGDFSLGQRINPLKKLLNHPDDGVAAAAATNLGAWQLKGADPDLLRILRNSTRAASVRRAASVSLGQLRGSNAAETLRKLAFDGETADRYFAVFGLAESDMSAAAKAAAELLVLDPGESNPVGLVQAFTRRNKGATFLIEALGKKKPHTQVLNRLSDYHRRTGQLPKALAQIFQALVPSSLAALLIKEDRKALTDAVVKDGDPVRGEKIFRRKELACFSCHAIGPIGSHIGPNLVAVGAAARTDYMIEAILEPNKAIAQHYENKLIQLADGRIHMGAITYKSDKEVIIRDSAQGGKEVKLPMSEVRKMRPMPSLMPAGLADQLKTRGEFLDLAKFISLLGRPGPYANDESPVIRKWKVAPGSDKPPASDTLWSTAYSMVDGVLPHEDLGPGEIAYAQGAVDVQVAGPVMLQLNSSKGLKLWVDDRQVNDLAVPLDLTAGRHTLIFAIHRDQRSVSGLRAELTTPPGSPAKYQPEGGL